jgi:hypothetical protein
MRSGARHRRTMSRLQVIRNTLWCGFLLLALPVQARHVPAARSLQQSGQVNAMEPGDSSWVAHECLWTSWNRSIAASVPAAAATTATAAVPTATASASAAAGATASATATASASAQVSAVGSASATAGIESAPDVADYTEDTTLSAAEGTTVASANATASSNSSSESKVVCSLNPSYLFSLPPPSLDSEK